MFAARDRWESQTEVVETSCHRKTLGARGLGATITAVGGNLNLAYKYKESSEIIPRPDRKNYQEFAISYPA